MVPENIHIPPWKDTGNFRWVGDGGSEGANFQGCGGEKRDLFPEGPRVLSGENLPI